MHIPKNAGTTFESILSNNFLEIVKIYNPKHNRFFTDVEILAIDNFFSRSECVAAHHFALPVNYNNHKKEYKLITFLRDPVSRANSFFNYTMMYKKDFFINYLNYPGKEINIYEYVKFVTSENTNVATEHKKIISNWQTYVFDRDLNIEAAKRRLIDEVYFAGITERFDESLLILKWLLEKDGVKFSINYVSKNRTKKKYRNDIFIKKASDELKRLNALDYELYDFANKQLDHLILQYGDKFNRDLNKFKKNQSLYQFYHPAIRFVNVVAGRWQRGTNAVMKNYK